MRFFLPARMKFHRLSVINDWLFLYWRRIIRLDPVVRREDNFIPGINHAIPRIKFIPGLNCIARSGDKFIFGINRANPGIRCFFVMKH